MKLHIQFSALRGWPGQKTASDQRRRGTFKATWSETIDLLEFELGKLNASNIVIEVDCDPREIRIDGHFRSDAKLRGPGVVLNFDSPRGSVRMPCDAFDNWKSNVRGIALSLEALRAVDRYGVTRSGEQYSGWTALPSPTPSPSVSVRRVAAAEWMVDQARARGFEECSAATVLNDFDVRRNVYKFLASRMHPDRGGGENNFKLLQIHIAAFE